MIKITDLIFEYPRLRCLDHIDCRIETGSVTALVGANGAGKTTLMRCIAGLETPLAGHIEVAGLDVSEKPREVHRLMGYLSDSFGLYRTLTVRQCLEYAAASQGLAQEKIAAAIKKTGEKLDLERFFDQPCGQLSRGWRQRVGIGQAIIHSPKVLILDEPASGLDPEARSSLAGLFRLLQNEGMTLLVSSHILAELDEYSTHLLVLREGKVIDQRALHTASNGQTQTIRRLSIVLAGDAGNLIARLGEWPGVVPASILADGDPQDRATFAFDFEGDIRQQAELLASLVSAGIPVAAYSEIKENLQQSYLALVKGDRPKKETLQ